jgi:L-ribulose-5-phosphate 4-epimerase
LSKWLKEKRLVLETARLMSDRGLVTGTSGNVSMRLTPDNGRELLAITPTSRYYDKLTPEDIPVIDFEAEPVEGDLAPSSESMLHIKLYQIRKDIGAVIHTHAVYSSALAVAHLPVPPILDDQVTVIGGEVKIAEYASSGSDELVENVATAIGDRNGVLMMNHGMLAAGKDLREAFTVCETLEKTSRIYYMCLTLGKVHLLSDEAIEAGQAYFKMLHGRQ